MRARDKNGALKISPAKVSIQYKVIILVISNYNYTKYYSIATTTSLQPIIGCSVGYKMDSYPRFSTLNSQVVEQANAALRRIKPSLSYMTSHNFLKHLKLFGTEIGKRTYEQLKLIPL